MCFSAEADFLSGAVVGAIGVATVREASDRKELPLAVLPLAFAVHQITEGFVWLSLEGKVSEQTGDVALYSYLFYAWALLPFFAPLAIYLVEPNIVRRRIMAALTVLGAGVGAYLLEALVTNDVTARIAGNTIDYRGVGDSGNVVTALYVAATCGTFLLSSQRHIRWFGVANLAAVIVIARERSEGLTSLWCIWAAVVSMLIWFQLREWRRAEGRVTGWGGAEEPPSPRGTPLPH